MSHKPTERKYEAYLLRMWHEGQENTVRLVLENAHTGTQTGFNDIEKLIAFLEENSAVLKTSYSRSSDSAN